MAITIYTPRQLLGVYYDDRLDAKSTYWGELGGYLSNIQVSTVQDIVFEKIVGRRRIAPMVQPTSQGKPIYNRRGSEAKLFRPSYSKPKDAVMASDSFSRLAGDMLSVEPRTPDQNFKASVADIMQFHRETIERRWEWLCAQATIYGAVTIDYEDGPSQFVDFGRDPSLTVIKTSNYWTTSYDIIGDLQLWCDAMQVAAFGGIPNRLTVGADVWAQMRGNTKLLDLMDLQKRNSDVDTSRGLVLPGSRNDNTRFVGTIGAGKAGAGSLDVFVYTDFYENDAGVQVKYMNQKDIVLTAPGVEGVMAFGAIMDHKAELAAVPVFPKMWEQEDPSGVFIMTQSAPLAIPVMPNRTFRARVLA